MRQQGKKAREQRKCETEIKGKTRRNKIKRLQILDKEKNVG